MKNVGTKTIEFQYPRYSDALGHRVSARELMELNGIEPSTF